MSIIICLEKLIDNSKVIWGQPLGVGNIPYLHYGIKRQHFFVWAASLPAAGEITSFLSDTPLLHASPVFSRPQLDFELAGDGRKKSGSCAWAMKRGPFIEQRGQTLGKSLTHSGMGFKWPYSLFELNGAGLSLFQHAETSLSLGEGNDWALNGWIGTWAKRLELETGKIMK